MARIKQRRDRHFIDADGRLYWINGPDQHCYLSEQRQWRSGLSFDEVLEWKQCAPSGLVSQRFSSVQAACEAFEHRQVQWTLDLYLRHMGDEMALQRGADDYKPTAIKQQEAQGGGCASSPGRARCCPPPVAISRRGRAADRASCPICGAGGGGPRRRPPGAQPRHPLLGGREHHAGPARRHQ